MLKTPSLLPVFRKKPTVKVYFLICTIGLLLMSLAQLTTRSLSEYEPERLIVEALQNGAQDARYAEIYRKRNKLPKDTKFLLLWNSQSYEPFASLGEGQKAFIDEKCSETNCYVTSDRNFLEDIKEFDALAFNGRVMSELEFDLPKSRSIHQKYIYFNTESAFNFPVCEQKFDGFFNLVASYKLNSDISYNYISIRDLEGKIVGPKTDMVWLKDMRKVEEGSILMRKIKNKTKAVAWFVSNCRSASGREQFVDQLQKSLKVYNLTVDIYGSCGPNMCPVEQKTECESKLERDYYFYLALENSIAEDYVTEKVLTALQHYTVPVVFGGANYSRFLPPGSYLDGRQRTPRQVAAKIAQLVWSFSLYKSYFKWRNHYTFEKPNIICGVCAALNNKTLMSSTSVYWDFRDWWNPSYSERCKWFRKSNG